MLPLVLVWLAVTGALGQQSTTSSSTSTASQIESEGENSQTPSALYPDSRLNYNSFQAAAQQQRPTYVSGRDAYSYSPYAFQYIAQGEDGSSSRHESADGTGRVVGSYTIQVEDGRRRVVDYVADQDGFRATIDTNEPGTEVQNPADVVFHSAGLSRSNQPAVYTPINSYRPTTNFRQWPTSRIYSQPNVVRPVYQRGDNYPYHHDSHAYGNEHHGHASSNYYYNDQRYHWH